MRNASLKNSLDVLVRALCRDYKRRAYVAALPETNHRVEIELRYINAKIYDAAAEIVGEELCEIFIEEIGCEIGYAKSRAQILSESTYKIYKKSTKKNIAKRLYLTE